MNIYFYRRLFRHRNNKRYTHSGEICYLTNNISYEDIWVLNNSVLIGNNWILSKRNFLSKYQIPTIKC